MHTGIIASTTMLKICLALILAVSLGSLAQPLDRRSSGLTQRREGTPRTSSTSQRFQKAETRYDPRSQYPAANQVEEETTKPNLKIRRRPKKSYYPKIVSFYQKPTTNNGYEFKYLTEDGVQRAERGYLSQSGVWTVEGSVASLADGNVAVVQSYIADGSGYKSSVRRYTPEKYRSLDDFIPWKSADDFEDDNKLGSGVISSLVGGG